MKRVPEDVESVSLSHTAADHAGVKVAFTRIGEVKLSGFSESLAFQFEFDRVLESVKNRVEPYGFVIRNFARGKQIRSLLSMGILLASMILSIFISYYSHAKSVGVNIADTSVVPTGNEYLKQAAEALKSTDVNKKLDALLLERLAGFENVRDVLSRQVRLIKIDLG